MSCIVIRHSQYRAVCCMGASRPMAILRISKQGIFISCRSCLPTFLSTSGRCMHACMTASDDTPLASVLSSWACFVNALFFWLFYLAFYIVRTSCCSFVYYLFNNLSFNSFIWGFERLFLISCKRVISFRRDFDIQIKIIYMYAFTHLFIYWFTHLLCISVVQTSPLTKIKKM